MRTVDQRLIFVGSYSPAEKTGIHVFEFDEADGSLFLRGSFAGVINPSYLVVHPNGRWLYAVSETGQKSHGQLGKVVAFEIERESMKIHPINYQSTNGDYPCHLSIDGRGRWLLVANYGTGSVAVYPIHMDGKLGEIKSFIAHKGRGPNKKRQERAHTHSTTFSLDNRYVIVADLGIDQLLIYQFDDIRGQLTPHTVTRTRPGAGPRHCAFHPSGRWLYLANELDNTVTVYAYDGDQGKLHELQTLDTLPPGSPENTAADIHVSAGGERVYVSNRGHHSIAVFAVDDSGSLLRLGFPPCGGDWPRNFSLSPDGRFMLVANRFSNEVAVLPVEVGKSELGEPVTKVFLNQPTCVHFWVVE